MATKQAQEAFRLKWHRARMYEKGMSRAAVQRKIGQLQAQKKLPQGAILSNSLRAAGKLKKDGRSPYRKWADQSWKNQKPGTKPFVPDNGKSPWRDFTDRGGARKIADKLDLGHDERQARYKRNKAAKSRVTNAAIQRRLAAQRKGKRPSV